jgi:hypothetical protein
VAASAEVEAVSEVGEAVVSEEAELQVAGEKTAVSCQLLVKTNN